MQIGLSSFVIVGVILGFSLIFGAEREKIIELEMKEASRGPTLAEPREMDREVQNVGLHKKQSIDPRIINKPSGADYLITGKGDRYGIWINKNVWKVLDKKGSEVFDLEFQHTKGDAYGIVIFERIQFPMENLKKIVLQNLNEISPDAKIVFEQDKNVNGAKVTAIKMEGTIEGVLFVYDGYLYSGPTGTIQIITYTTKQLFPGFEHDINDFLNGFVLLDQ